MAKKKKRDEIEYDFWKVKVPKRDKAGKDISDIDPEIGGRRRKDGTLSGVPYDFERIDESDDHGKYTPTDPYSYEEVDSKTIFDSVLDIIDFGVACANRVLDYAEKHPDKAEKALGFGRKIADKVTPKMFRRSMKNNEKEFERHKTTAEIISKDGFNQHWQENNLDDISEDEAKSLILDTLFYYIQLKRNMERMRKSKIIGNNHDELSFDDVIAKLDAIVNKYPALMEDKETTENIFSVLSLNKDSSENQLITSTLKID